GAWASGPTQHPSLARAITSAAGLISKANAVAPASAASSGIVPTPPKGSRSRPPAGTKVWTRWWARAGFIFPWYEQRRGRGSPQFRRAKGWRWGGGAGLA